MDAKQLVKTSKFLSLVLRHQPDVIGIKLDQTGWVTVDQLLVALNQAGRPLTREQLDTVVRTSDKQRFALSADGSRIRANQGHSVEVELDYDTAVPPELLYHGTPEHAVDSILQTGIQRMSRHHVHLHADRNVVDAVGKRRGKSVILTIRSGDMHRAGHEFMVTPNQVWLVDEVPNKYIVTGRDS